MSYAARRVAPAEARAEVLALWERNRPSRAKLPEIFQWYYLSSPLGPAHCFLLDSSAEGRASELAGMCGVGERRIEVAGRPARAALLGDFLVEKRHRTLFPALTLQRAAQAWARQSFDLLYGFPNAAATPVLERLGFRVLGQLCRYSFVLRYEPYIRRATRLPRLARLAALPLDGWRRFGERGISRRLPDGLELLHIAEPDERFDRLWHERMFRTPIMGQRDAAFLRWRFARRPDQRCEIYGLCQCDTGELRAYAAVHHDGHTGHIRDLLGRSVEDIGLLLPPLCGELRERSLVSVSFLCSGPEALIRCLQANHFVRRDSRRTLIGYRGEHCPGDAQLWETPENWYVTEADEDQ